MEHKVLGLGFLNTSCDSQKRSSPLGAPGGAAHALHNSLGLHSNSKRRCDWLPGVMLGPGSLEKVGCA